ncbi:dTDP-4-dehydrorhamnose reductase [Formivibrio citricus]|uniref:dTDP-4-dehydrorhamnose reductase n=1 Tax=Formivibrio citricus TaxID=83765 RepID=A0A1I4XZF3_9NEIS|nr:dTDP-4-dehydrorhamnose reductase [Formivibrio citricus]SFN30619.1 dTDP-4-dehydrorhamnose reductase [Formivibrio citricus]
MTTPPSLLSSPRILITGKNGQVGFELQRSLAVLGEIVAMDREECDLADPDAIRALVREVRPDIIVNPAAHTAVDKAESESELAAAINATAPAVLAEEAAKLGALIVHYSTDYVFNGSKQGWYTETDAPDPQSVYGKTKLAGEQAVAAGNPRHIILRTSWVFGAHGGNFLKTILRLARERDSLRIIADQHGAPTSAALLADITAQIVAQYLRSENQASFPFGLYHAVSQGETTWHGYASHIVEVSRRRGQEFKVGEIAPIPTSEYPLPAPRPANSRLSADKLQKAFGLVLPSWQTQVEQVLTLLDQ